MNVDVLSIDNEKYVIGESLAKAVGTKGCPHKWIERQIRQGHLIHRKDWFDFGDGIMFSPETAASIFSNTKKVETRQKSNRKNCVERDEYGLPILPPQERSASLINPYSLDPDKPFYRRPKQKLRSLLD